MTKLLPKRKPILRIVLLSIVAIPVLFVLYIVATLLLSPVFDSIDEARFTKLDSASRELYAKLQAASGGEETWQYDAECEELRSGPWPTGEYSCSTKLFTEFSASSATQLSTLHDKYFPVIDAAAMLEQRTVLEKQPAGQFGTAFVVSGAMKEYTFTNDDSIDCSYLAKLSHGETNEDVSQLYGTSIAGSVGLLRIEVYCHDKASGNWYST